MSASASRWRLLAALGQSVWYDNVARPALDSGLLAKLIEEDHVTGGTSNPSIFAKAVADSDLYDDDIAAAGSGVEPQALFERVAVKDIQDACALFMPVWERTGGQDGYVSLEEEADIAFDAEAAVRRGHELRALVDRPNVMIKVPGTEAGVEAFGRLTREGVSVNVTLLFSRERYRAVAESYVSAIEERVAAGEDVSAIASVASFFVSRIDAKADAVLPGDSPLRGKTAIANARLAYAEVFVPAFTSDRWRRLASAGANLQRPLWASTGVKDPNYPATLYIDELVGAGTVTTVPDATLDAFRADGIALPALHLPADDARRLLDDVAAAGVDLDQITADLERDGVQQFGDAYDEMLAAIANLNATKNGNPMDDSTQKVVQYLGEAHASEQALTRVLQSQIAMTPRGSYRSALESHLDETRDHVARLQRRLGQLGAGGNPLAAAITLAESLIGQALALGKTPLDLLRGSGGEEKVLKNAKDACATEALEIATYTAIERLARAVDDDQTAELAASIREDEERMLARILREIPQLTGAVVGADVEGDGSYDIGSTGAGEAVKRTVTGAPASAEELAIAGYDGLTVAEISGRLGGLSQAELAKVDAYERRHQDRTGITERITRLRGDEPWPGYDELTVGEVVAVLDEGDDERGQRVREYEREHKNRAGVLRAAGRRPTRDAFIHPR